MPGKEFGVDNNIIVGKSKDKPALRFNQGQLASLLAMTFDRAGAN